MNIEHELNTKQVLAYLAVVFVMLLFFFYGSGVSKVFSVFLILIFALQIPGSLILHIVTGKFNAMTLLLGIVIAIAHVSLWAYLFGIFSIHFKYSFIISIGVPYLLYAKNILSAMRMGIKN